MSELFDMTEWGPPLAVVAAALAGGIGLSFRLRRVAPEADLVERESHRLDLENRRDDALQQLAALETQQHTMNPEDYAAERKALLTQGSNAMRELDEQGGMAPASPAASTGAAQGEAIKALTAAFTAGQIDPVTYAKAIAALNEAPAAPAPGAAPAPRSEPISAAPLPAKKDVAAPPTLSPAWQGGIYALVGAALIGGLLYYISDAAQPRRDGRSMTGNQDLGGAQAPVASQGGKPPWVAQELAKAEAALEANPNDIAALNTLTQLNLDQPSVAWNHNEAARKVDPTDPDARMFEAVITSIMSMPEKAQEKFDALLADVPDHAGAWAYKGLTLMEAKRFDEAAVALQKAKDLGLNDHSIDNALAAAKNGGVAVAPPAMGGGGNPGAPGAPIASGTIELDPGRASFKAVQVFVNISDPAMPGPPVAAVKLPPGPFPMSFVVTDADIIPMMANRGLPPNFVLKVRMDDDGNAFTKAPTDPQAQLEGLSRGATGLKLLLK